MVAQSKINRKDLCWKCCLLHNRKTGESKTFFLLSGKWTTGINIKKLTNSVLPCKYCDPGEENKVKMNNTWRVPWDKP